MRKKTSVFFAGCALIALAFGASNSAHAIDRDLDEISTPAKSEERLQSEITTYILRFSHPVSLQDAVTIAKEAGLDAKAFRFENQNLLGEYSPDPGVPIEDYLETFYSDFGVSPAVVGVLLEISAEEAAKHTTREIQSEIGAEFPLQEALGISTESRVGQELSAIEKQHPEERSDTMSLSATRWDPDIVMQHVTRNTGASFTTFSGTYIWGDLDTSPLMLPDKHGLEFEVNVYTPNAYGIKPFCVPAIGYKLIPFAVNQYWSWSSWVSDPSAYGVIFNLATLGVYPDYNDLSDECNRNSIALGVASPWDIPLGYMSSAYVFGTQIDAPNGLDSNGNISAVVQTVSRHHCEANPSMPLTDCMGIVDSGWGANRPVLAAWRNWVAPNKCWWSHDYGEIPPVEEFCMVP